MLLSGFKLHGYKSRNVHKFKKKFTWIPTDRKFKKKKPLDGFRRMTRKPEGKNRLTSYSITTFLNILSSIVIHIIV